MRTEDRKKAYGIYCEKEGRGSLHRVIRDVVRETQAAMEMGGKKGAKKVFQMR